MQTGRIRAGEHEVHRRNLLTSGLAVFGLMFANNFIPKIAAAQSFPIPKRPTLRPITTTGVPHMQIDVQPVPGISEELIRRADALPGVEIRNTVISLSGTKGFWLSESLPLARPDTIVGGREFAHIHPDGSLHCTLNPLVAQKAVAAGWAVFHPWSTSRPGWEGFVMIYTPQSQFELNVVSKLVRSGYDFVTKGS